MNTTHKVAIVVDVATPVERNIIRGISTFVHQVGNWSLYLEEDIHLKFPDLRVWKGDGVIINSDEMTYARKIAKRGIPVIGLGGWYGHSYQETGIPYLAFDHVKVARLAAEHLMERGYRRFGFCGFSGDPSTFWSEARARSFEAWAIDAGLPCSVNLGFHEPTQRWHEMHEQMCLWLDLLEKPVGIMACNDFLARYVLDACRILGFSTPKDVAVIGVDNDDLMCELTVPSLTSVDLGARRMGYEAASLLNQIMQGEEPSQLALTILPEGVITRQSSDVLAIKDEDVVDAVEFIRKNIGKEMQVHDVLEAACLSRSALESRFKATLGRTIHSEMLRQRADRAKHLLVTTEMSIKEVARKTGFSSAQYLTTVFRRELNQTPAQVRRDSRS